MKLSYIMLFCLIFAMACARGGNPEANGITVDVYVKGDTAPQLIYHYAQQAGALGHIGEPNLHIGVLASDRATSASTTVFKTKTALAAITGMITGAVAGSAAGPTGAAAGAALGGAGGTMIDKLER